jgi:hypothetical protein
MSQLLFSNRNEILDGRSETCRWFFEGKLYFVRIINLHLTLQWKYNIKSFGFLLEPRPFADTIFEDRTVLNSAWFPRIQYWDTLK